MNQLNATYDNVDIKGLLKTKNPIARKTTVSQAHVDHILTSKEIIGGIFILDSSDKTKKLTFPPARGDDGLIKSLSALGPVSVGDTYQFLIVGSPGNVGSIEQGTNSTLVSSSMVTSSGRLLHIRLTNITDGQETYAIY